MCPTIGIPRPTRTPRYRPAGTGVAALTWVKTRACSLGFCERVKWPHREQWFGAAAGKVCPLRWSPNRCPAGLRGPCGQCHALPLRPPRRQAGRDPVVPISELRMSGAGPPAHLPPPLDAHGGPPLHRPLCPADTHVDGPRWTGGRVTVWRAPPTPDTRKGSPVLPEPNRSRWPVGPPGMQP